jgi:hypothetical protein
MNWRQTRLGRTVLGLALAVGVLVLGVLVVASIFGR